MNQTLGKFTSLAAAAITSVLLFTLTFVWMQPPHSVLM